MALSGSQQYVGSGKVWTFLVAASIVIYAGESVALNANGYVIKATDTSGSIYLGIATETIDNSAGSAGDKSVKVDIGGAMVLLTHTTGSLADPTNRGDDVYADGGDACDAYAGAANPMYLGKIVEVVSATKVWVKVKPFLGIGAEIAAADGAALAVTNLEDGSANNTLEAITDTSMSDQSAAIERNFDKICDEVNALITLTSEIKAKLNAIS